jgi:drug/metabolite transporter (DMT)-like permease
LRGAAYMIAASAGFALMGTLVKAVSSSVPPTEIAMWRSAVTGVFVLLLAWQGGVSLRPHNLPMQLVRGLMGIFSMMLYFQALSRLPLGDAVLLTYLSPLLVATFSPWATGERAPPRVWRALLLGIVGVALVAGPQGEGDLLGVACGLGAAACAASSYLSIRVLTRTDSPLSIVFWFSCVGTAVSSVSMWDGHAPLGGSVLVALLAIGGLGAASQWSLTRSYATAPAAQVSVFAYSTPVFAYLLGTVAFGELPAWSSVAGAASVVLAGALAARE